MIAWRRKGAKVVVAPADKAGQVARSLRNAVLTALRQMIMARRAEMSGELIVEEALTMKELDRPTRKLEERSLGAVATRGLRALGMTLAILSVAEPWGGTRKQDPSTQAKVVDEVKGDINRHEGIAGLIFVAMAEGVIGQADCADQEGLTVLHWTRYDGLSLVSMSRGPVRKWDVDTVRGPPGARPMRRSEARTFKSIEIVLGLIAVGKGVSRDWSARCRALRRHLLVRIGAVNGEGRTANPLDSPSRAAVIALGIIADMMWSACRGRTSARRTKN